MTNDSSNTNALETADTQTVEAPKRERNEASRSRIAYEQNQLVEKQARLATLKPGSAAFARCERSIAVTSNFIAELESKLAARLAKQAEPKVAPKFVSFNIEIEPSNESDPEHVLSDVG